MVDFLSVYEFLRCHAARKPLLEMHGVVNPKGAYEQCDPEVSQKCIDREENHHRSLRIALSIMSYIVDEAFSVATTAGMSSLLYTKTVVIFTRVCL